MIREFVGSYNDGENLIIRIIESEDIQDASMLFELYICELQGWDEIERECFRVLPLNRIQRIK